MFKTWSKLYIAFIIFIFVGNTTFAQQDMEFHLSNTLLQGKNILKVKRDFNDSYLWVLTNNNEIYRINSETLVIDDYTSKFAAFAGSAFFDIAGNSKDEVYIAQSDKVIKYLNGNLSTITSTDGLTGQISSLYFDNSAVNTVDNAGNQYTTPTLLISTSTGIDRYYTGNSKLYHNVQSGYTVKVGTYKRVMIYDTQIDLTYYFKDNMHKVGSTVYQGLYVGYIYLTPDEFGSQLKASYYNGGFDYYGSNFSYLGNQYWATEKGLFQIRWSYSYNPDITGYHHYLSGQHINQISSIYGLASLGYANTRENLLVATDEGLYFSNSKYFPDNVFPDYEFYHYDGLGNKKINYIDVNAYVVRNDINTALNLIYDYCENGVWIGAEDGLYLLRPDYKNYFDQNQALQAIAFDGHSNDESGLQLCPGQTTKAHVYINTNAQIQWYKNGQEIANQSGETLEINSGGEYYAVIYDPCNNLHIKTNHLTVAYFNGTAIPFNYPDKLKFCYGSTATLSIPNNPDFQYRWYKDGVLNGVTTPSIDITENGKYKLEVNSCAGTWVATKEVEVSFIQMPKPIVKAAQTTICAGVETTLSASVAFDATGITNWQNYTYKWYRDGVLLPAATASINTSAAGKYKVEVTACVGNNNTSDELELKVITLPSVQISTVKDIFCEGETAVINSNLPADPQYTITWFRDNVLMPANTNKTAITTTIGGAFYYTVTSNITGLICSVTTSPKYITFTPGPDFNFNYPGIITRCAGESVALKIDGSSSYKYRWYKDGALNSEVSSVLTVTTPGKYKGEVSVCENSWIPTTEVEVRFTQLPAPVISSDKSGYCIGDNALLSVNVPVNPLYTINWYLNGTIISNWQDQKSIQTNVNGSYMVKLISSSPVCEQISLAENIAFESKPTIEIEKVIKTTLCEGETVELKINQMGGTAKWSTGETGSTIFINRSGSYDVVYTSPGGCQAQAHTDVVFYPKPLLNLFDQAICAFKKETLTLTAPMGYKSYSWNNGESTSAMFEISKPQTVSLTVTDFNNCKATQSIRINNKCPELQLANTFTPNGDGINDKWVITGVEDDPTVVVRVFNRAGVQVFESRGYQNAWDGTYNSKKLSAGVYYYVITTKASSEILKGSLTIIY